LWPDVERGRRQVLMVGGEPGVGKSRLVAEAAGALYDIGVTVLVGESSPDAGVSYQPFVEMLDHLFSKASPAVWEAAVEGGGPQLGRLSGARRAMVDQAPLSGGEARRELFNAVARFFQVLAGDRPLAIAVEDLHWAQLPTLALLQHVVQACSDTRLLVSATFRTTVPDRSDEVAARVAELHRLEGVRRVDLAGLDTDAVAEYVRLRTGLPLAELRAPAALLRDRTGGTLSSCGNCVPIWSAVVGCPLCVVPSMSPDRLGTRSQLGWRGSARRCADLSSWPRCSAMPLTCPPWLRPARLRLLQR
jgi:hypothetical protein